jgi:uncharacterized protein with NRDE domain
MCLTVLGFQVSKAFPFILIHNRDEFFDRAFEPLHPWGSTPEVYGGKDIRSDGMWLGINSAGRFAVITNFRSPSTFQPHAPSRGFLVRDFLQGNLEPKEFIASVIHSIPSLNPFNLIFGDVWAPYYFSSRKQQLVTLPPGIHSLSNHDLDTPWPKLQLIRSKFSQLVEEISTTGAAMMGGSMTDDPISQKERLTSQLLEFLSDSTLAPITELPKTGLPIEREHALSSVFVRTPVYGTVTSSVILVDAFNKVTFLEKQFYPTPVLKQVEFQRTDSTAVSGVRLAP